MVKLGLKIRLTNVKAQKIIGLILKTLVIVIVSFEIEDKLRKTRFF